MKPDTFATFARCRAAALAAMIQAGGKPLWVAAGPPPPAARAVAAKPPPQRGRTVRPAAAESTACVGFSAAESARLAGLPPRVVEHLAVLLSHLGRPRPAETRPALSRMRWPRGRGV